MEKVLEITRDLTIEVWMSDSLVDEVGADARGLAGRFQSIEGAVRSLLPASFKRGVVRITVEIGGPPFTEKKSGPESERRK